MSRFTERVPKSDRELEQFYLQTAKKLAGTDTTLEELDQRGNWPGQSVTDELERAIRSIVGGMMAPLKAQLAEIDRRISKGDIITVRTQITELERKINSIEASARF